MRASTRRVCVCVCVRGRGAQHSVGCGRYVLNYYLIKPLSPRGSYGGRTWRYSLGSRVGNGRIDLSLEGRALSSREGDGRDRWRRDVREGFSAQVKYEFSLPTSRNTITTTTTLLPLLLSTARSCPTLLESSRFKFCSSRPERPPPHKFSSISLTFSHRANANGVYNVSFFETPLLPHPSSSNTVLFLLYTYIYIYKDHLRTRQNALTHTHTDGGRHCKKSTAECNTSYVHAKEKTIRKRAVDREIAAHKRFPHRHPVGYLTRRALPLFIIPVAF